LIQCQYLGVRQTKHFSFNRNCRDCSGKCEYDIQYEPSIITTCHEGSNVLSSHCFIICVIS
uniref:Spiggin beta n=1 Tax=Schistosoma curassoni TaxID=6186 RepID=A0A183L859_9TREM